MKCTVIGLHQLNLSCYHKIGERIIRDTIIITNIQGVLLFHRQAIWRIAVGNNVNVPTSRYDINSSQYNFVKNDLEAASRNPDIKWIIVYSYRPQYSSPSEHPENGDLRDLYHPIFQKHQVDIVLQAHNHNYQRTYPIKYD